MTRLRVVLLVLSAASLSVPSLAQEEYRTPRAGEAFTGNVFGHSVDVPARDRTTTNVLDVGVQLIPDGPDAKRQNPFLSVFLWRNRQEGRQRFRAVLLGVYDTIRYDLLPWDHKPLEFVATFDNFTLPTDRSEYVEGARIRSEELRWYQMRAGFGLGYRIPIAPLHQENHLEAALTYEPGYLSFNRGDKTDPGYLVPKDTYEGRFHLRFRLDSMERNPIELPHKGFATGIDAVHGRRDQWDDWGGPVLGFESGQEGKEWNELSLYAVAALPVPFVRSERHRLVLSAYGGASRNVDRFSAFRLGGGPTTADWEALSRVVLPGAALEEFYASTYGTLNVEYRFEMLFFAYLRVRGTLAEVERLRFNDAGVVVPRIESMNALSIGVTSGFFWHSQLELAYTYNFGILRQRGGVPEAGDGAILVHWSKSF
jgi:hypothetical protein